MVTKVLGCLMLLTQILLLSTITYSEACQLITPPDCSNQPLSGPSFHPHESDCSLYYRCDDDIRTTFSCPEGQIFNDVSQKCVNQDKPCQQCVPASEADLPSCAEPSICGVNDQGLFKPYPQNCTMYVFCSFGVPLLRSCLSDQHFSPVQMKCMTPELANCPLCGTASTPNITTTNAMTTTTEAITRTMFTITTPTSTTKVPTTLTMVTITTSPSIPQCNVFPTCGIFENGISKPYPPDCTHYVYCVFGNGEIRMCNEGLHFSPSQSECMTPLLANCPQCIDFDY